jgi:hypothetical protein
VKVSLHEGALGLVIARYQCPSLPSGGAICELHFGGVRKSLREEEAGDSILVIPLFNICDLGSGKVVGINRCRAEVCACEVAPSARHFHRGTEAHLKDGPVSAIRLEVQYIC